MGLLFLTVPSASASFACGYVNNSLTHSASWLNVIVYYPEDILDIASCQINPQNKFCCDLLKINSDPLPGRTVFAEVFDISTGLISNPVQTTLTEDGYVVFPDMQIEEALSINFSKRVLVNKSHVRLNISTSPRFPNLKYSLTNQNLTVQKSLCNNCTFSEASISLPKGHNELKIIAHGSREIYEELDFYSLDYLIFERIAECEDCSRDEEGYFFPRKEMVNITLKLNSSHNIEGVFSEFIPINWLTNLENLEEYSETHDKISFKVYKSFSEFNYTVETPSLFFPRLYEFQPEFEGHSFNEIIRLTRLTIWPSILYYKKVFSRFEAYQNRKREIAISPSNALIVKSDNPLVNLIAIYPNTKLQNTYAILTSRKFLFWKRDKTEFRITSNVENNEIDNILIFLKIPKNKTPTILQDEKEILPKKTGSDLNFNYYEATILKKDPFTIQLKK